MALQKQTVPIPLTGLNQRTDEKNAPIGTLDLVENAYREQTGEFRKRSGTSVYNTTTDSGTISDAQFAGQLNDIPFILTSDTAFSRSLALSKWINKGAHRTYIHSASCIYPSTYRQAACDVIYYGGLLFWAFEEWERSGPGYNTPTGLYLVVTDATTGQVVQSKTTIVTPSGASFYYKPRLIQVGTSIIVFYERPTALLGSGAGGTAVWDLKAKRIANPTTAPGTLSSESTVTQIGTTGNPVTNLQTWDVTVYGGQCKVVYRNTSNVWTKRWNEAMTSGGSDIDQGYVGNPYAIQWLDWDGSDGNLWFMNGLSLCKVNATTLANVSGNTDTTTINNVCGYVTSATDCVVFADIIGTHRRDTVTSKYAMSSGIATSTSTMRSVGLASRPFKVNSIWNIMLAYESINSSDVDTQESQYFQVDVSNWKVVGKPLPSGLGAGIPYRKSFLSSGAVISASKTIVPIAKVFARDYLDTVQGKPLYNLFALTIDTQDYRLSQPVNAGEALIFPGAQPKMYDSGTLTELGFHYGPTVVASSQAGLTLENGTYSYKATYEWNDGAGRLHRSIDSPVSASITISSINHYAQLIVGTYRVTDKAGVRICIYREDGDGIYHRVTSISNDTTADTVTVNDTMTQANADSGEGLYTNGNVLQNIAPPACTVLAAAKNRVWLGGTLTGEWWYSKEVVSGYGVEFSDFLVSPNQDGMTTTGFAELDDKMAVFYKDAVCVVIGDGPNALGQGDFTINKVASNTGTTKPRTVVSTPAGVPFLSKDGWRILDRGLAIQPFGLEVQDYDTNTYIGAVVVPARSHAMFFTSEGRTLVYDWMNQQWYTFTGQAAVAAFIIGNVYAYVSSTGVVSYEVDQQFNDNGAAIAMKFRTTWLNFAGFGGFQRIYAVQAIGEYVGAHTLKTTWEFNLDTATTYPYTVTPTANPYRFETRPPVQQCATARLTVEEVTSGTTGAFRLSGMAGVIGIKAGMKPVAATARLT